MGAGSKVRGLQRCVRYANRFRGKSRYRDEIHVGGNRYSDRIRYRDESRYRDRRNFRD